ncbi:MAG: hypothetical protein ACT4OL_06140, partial [Nitrospiraceae bacterium]
GRGKCSGWRGERGDFLTRPPRPRGSTELAEVQDAVLLRARATEGSHWGMGEVSTAGLFAATGPAT